MVITGSKTSIRSHRDLIVWQKAIELVVCVYEATEHFPSSELYSLTKQVRRAVTSIPANIAEGQGRRLAREFMQFLGHARGSLWELDTHLEIARRVGFLNETDHVELLRHMDEVGRILNGLMRSLRSTANKQTSI